MWKIWKEELYKMASRKIIWIGLLLLLAFLGLRTNSERRYYSVTINGTTYFGQEAIEKDQALTAQYAGILTIDKMQNIYNTYGFYYHDDIKDQDIGNFCNRFITEHMTTARQTGWEFFDDIQFLQGEEWEAYAAPLLNGTVYFDYVYGWNDLKEIHSILTVMALFILFIIGISPVFSEEYALKTAPLLLATQKGKQSGIWLKMTAALFFPVVLYAAVTLYIWFLYFIVYGTQGLDASPALIGMPLNGYCPPDIRSFFLFAFGLNLAGLLLLTCMTLAVSALCRNAFLALILSLALFLLPYACLNYGIVLLSSFLNASLIKALFHFFASMPFYLSMSWGFAFSSAQIAQHLCIALAVAAACTICGYHAYRNYPG